MNINNESRKPTLSVIIPVYNMGEFLTTTIRSIQKQTLKNLEVICIDDGSTDNSCMVIKEEKESDKRIVLFQQEHSGPGVARNRGIEIANGEYISFLDADDFYYETDALEKMCHAAKRENAWVCASYKMMEYHNDTVESSKVITFDKPEREIWIKYKDFPQFYGFTNFIYEKDFLQRNQIVFPSRSYFEDPPFLCCALATAQKFLLVPKILYCYRSVYKTRKVSKDRIREMLLGMDEMMNLASAHSYPLLYKNVMEELIKNKKVIEYLNLENLQYLMKIAEYNETCKYRLKHSPIESLLNGCRELSYEEYVFPFHQLPKNSRVIIYGADYIGRALYYQAKKYGRKFVEVIAIVDRNFEDMEGYDLPIQSPEIIKTMHCDYVLIAVKTRATALSIRKTLNGFGIDDDRIIWQTDMYLKKYFYENIFFDILEKIQGKTEMT